MLPVATLKGLDTTRGAWRQGWTTLFYIKDKQSFCKVNLIYKTVHMLDGNKCSFLIKCLSESSKYLGWLFFYQTAETAVKSISFVLSCDVP